MIQSYGFATVCPRRSSPERQMRWRPAWRASQMVRIFSRHMANCTRPPLLDDTPYRRRPLLGAHPECEKTFGFRHPSIVSDMSFRERCPASPKGRLGDGCRYAGTGICVQVRAACSPEEQRKANHAISTNSPPPNSVFPPPPLGTSCLKVSGLPLQV